MYARPAAAAFRQGHYAACARQRIPCADDRMTRHRQLAPGCKYSQTLQASVIARRKDKDGLGEIHLARYLLHLFIREAFGFWKDRKRIAVKNTIRKNIQLNEIVLSHSRFSSPSIYRKINT
jgi:hypothetical protein